MGFGAQGVILRARVYWTTPKPSIDNTLQIRGFHKLRTVERFPPNWKIACHADTPDIGIKMENTSQLVH
jgi:hypothetical protein